MLFSLHTPPGTTFPGQAVFFYALISNNQPKMIIPHSEKVFDKDRNI